MPDTDPTSVGPRRSAGPIFLGLLALTVGAGCLRLYVGSSSYGWPEGNVARMLGSLLLAGWLPHLHVESGLLEIRLLSLLLGMTAGAALAASGVALQALLRNSLAEPFILGLSTGAALGVLVQGIIVHQFQQNVGPHYLGALLGAAASMAIVFAVSRRRGLIDPLGLLLTGVVLSTVGGSAILALNYLFGRGQLDIALSRWMMGYLNQDVEHSRVLLIVAALTVGGVALIGWRGKAMDVAAFSDLEALSMGVHLGRLRTELFLVASVLAAGAVVLAGPLAFVGLICPHLARTLLGPSHRNLVLGAVLLGATLVISADIAAQVLDHSWHIGTMPIGIFTSLLGGPIFLWMLRPQLGKGEP
jgi:iron complex transport system permease protein